MSSARLRWAVRTSAWAPTEPAQAEFLLALVPTQSALVVRHSRAEDQQRALAARLLERAAAAAALGLPLGEAALKRTRGGKPYVASDVPKPHAPNWNFSVSHEVREAGGHRRLASAPAPARRPRRSRGAPAPAPRPDHPTRPAASSGHRVTT